MSTSLPIRSARHSVREPTTMMDTTTWSTALTCSRPLQVRHWAERIPMRVAHLPTAFLCVNVLFCMLDHYMQVLNCKQHCAVELALNTGKDKAFEDFLPSHFNYLQFSYYNSESLIWTCHYSSDQLSSPHFINLLLCPLLFRWKVWAGNRVR